MAIFCDLCGRSIDGKAKTVQSHQYTGFEFQYDDLCAKRVFAMLKDRSDFAQGATNGTGLHWELVEDARYGERAQAVLEPRRANRILALCRERGINRDELAEGLGTTPGVVGRWLKSYMNTYGRPCGLSMKWAKRLVIFFDLDSNSDLFERELTGEAPAVEFVQEES